MHNGTFDDRNDACLSVKQWLIVNEARDYTHANLRRLAMDIVRSDRDPVDELRIALREATYGMVKGTVEFAAEEMERAGFGTTMAHVIAAMRRIAGELPREVRRARHVLEEALAVVERMRASGAASHLERSAKALELAMSMLRERPAQAVAA